VNADLIPRKEIITLVQGLVQTPSVNGRDQEVAVAQVIYDFAVHHGLDVEMVALETERPCVLVRVGPAGEPGLVLVGHMDTVPTGDEAAWLHPPFGGVISGDRLYGRGAIDNKGGITAALAALLMLKPRVQDLKRPVLLAFVPDEESGATGRLGVRFLHETGRLAGEGAIYTYPDIDKINIGHRGLYRLKIVTQGKSFHSGSLAWQEADRNYNAVTGMAQVLLALEGMEIPDPEPDPFFQHFRTLITPTLVSGGAGPSIIPNRYEAIIDIRMVPSISKEFVDREIVKVIDEIKEERAPLKIDLSQEIYLPPTIIPEDSRVVRALRASAQEIIGLSPKITVSGPANESYLLNQFGIPTCTFGPVGENAHAVDEYVEIESIFQVAHVYAATALQLSEDAR
jgi:succinyl-diaminopimelate desuccinylase